MAKQYFQIIKSQFPKEDVATIEHGQRLNNFIRYKYPATDKQIQSVEKFDYSERPFKVCVCSQSTSTCMKNQDFVITTTLLCEDEEIQPVA